MPSDRAPAEGRSEATAPPTTIRLSGDVVSGDIVVSLDREAQREGLTVSDQIALRDANLREWLANRVVPVFLKANVFTLIGLGVLVALDEVNLTLHLITPADRIVGEHVVLALLGATTVQLGTVAALIARYLFPSRPAPDPD